MAETQTPPQVVVSRQRAPAGQGEPPTTQVCEEAEAVVVKVVDIDAATMVTGSDRATRNPVGFMMIWSDGVNKILFGVLCSQNREKRYVTSLPREKVSLYSSGAQSPRKIFYSKR